VPVPKPNYHHAKKQKELARKARQQEKKQRRLARGSTAEEPGALATTPEKPVVPGDPASGSGT
jgi:hypothetical protein